MLKTNISGIKTKYLLFAIMVFVSVVSLSLMNIITAKADAGQVQTRSIQMTNSATGATSVQYTIKFNVATASTSPNLKGIVVDICSGNSSPIVGVVCIAPTSFTWGTPTVTSATVGANNIATWTAGLLNAGRTFTLTNATGVTTAANDTVTIVLSGISNPSDVDTVTAGSQVGTYYGRIITFNDNTQVASYLATNGIAQAGYVDYGGIALSTTQNLTVSAKVQEQITFCVYTTGTTCSNGTGTAVNIPDANTPLTTTAVSTADAKFGVASNALGGVTVRMRGFNPANPATAYSTLTAGAFTIDPYGAGNGVCTADSTSTSVEQFGLRIIPASANVTAATPYACAAGQHGWDTTGNVNTDNVTSTYGDTIATTAGPQAEEQNTLNFAAKAALTTQASLYTIGLNFIATGTY